VSPPVMLQTWTMPAAPKLEGIGGGAGRLPRRGSPATLRAFLDEAGYTSIVATNSEFEIERYPRLGDVISATSGVRGGFRRKEDGRWGPATS